MGRKEPFWEDSWATLHVPIYSSAPLPFAFRGLPYLGACANTAAHAADKSSHHPTPLFQGIAGWKILWKTTTIENCRTWKQIFGREGRKVLSKLSKKDIRANVLRLFSVALSRLSFPMSEINTAKWFSDRVATFHLWPMLESTWVGDWYLVPMCQSTIGLRWPLLVTTETRSTTQPSNTYSRGFIPTNRHQNDKTFSQLLGFSLFDYKNECSFLPADRVTTSPKLCRAHPMFHLCTTLMIWIWNFYKLSKWVSISIDGWNLATYYIHAPFGITENLSLNLIG